MQLAKFVFDIGYFLRAVEVQLRFGDLSRASLRLLKLGIEGQAVEISWIARPADIWDQDSISTVRDRKQSTQALLDAIALRDLLFYSLPGIDRAALRVFRERKAGELELIIIGAVTREQEAPEGYFSCDESEIAGPSVLA